jgi:murein DD-endopeptidase MepM/ murein hydrolase activator NlpD/surface antigen
MQVELQKLPARWTGNPNHVSSFVANGSRPGISVAAGLAAGNYGWRYRVVNSAGVTGNWVPANNPDFIVQAVSTPVRTTSTTIPAKPKPTYTPPQPTYTPEPASEPSISRVSPASLLPMDGNQPLTISGNNFQNRAKLSFVSPDGGTINSSAAKLTFVSANQIIYQINNKNVVGTWTVQVINPDGQSSSPPVSFTVQAIEQPTPSIVTSPIIPVRTKPTYTPTQPTYTPEPAAAPFISRVSPASLLPMDGNQPLTISGNNFQNRAKLSFVSPDGGTINSSAAKLTFVSANQINYQINNLNAVGNWTVQVINPDGQFSHPVSFTVAAIAQSTPSPAPSTPIPVKPKPTYTPAPAVPPFISRVSKASTQNSVARFLIFPIQGVSFKTAEISSVFDHAMTAAYKSGTRVVAYNGQEGTVKDTSWFASVGNEQLYGYKKTDGAAFTLPQGNYTGGATLNYEGHTGYDFPYPHSFEVVAAAAGKVHKWNDDTNQIEIDHENGFSTFYIHMLKQDTASLVEGSTVKQGQHLGYCGNYSLKAPVGFHLHFTVKKGSVRVDPYGWSGSGEDPYYTCFGVRNEVLWIDSPSPVPSSSSTTPGFNLHNPQVLTPPNTAPLVANNTQPGINTPGVSVKGPRLGDTSPAAYCATSNPFIKELGGQCTAFCWGRANEKLGITNLPISHAQLWFSEAKAAAFKVGQEPQPNSIAVWSYYVDKDDGTPEHVGHVAFIEDVIGDKVIFNEANFLTALYGLSLKSLPGCELWGGGYDGSDGEHAGPKTMKISDMNPRRLKKTSDKTMELLGYIYLEQNTIQPSAEGKAAKKRLPIIPDIVPTAPSPYSSQPQVSKPPSSINPPFPARPNMNSRSSKPERTPMMPGVSLVPEQAP